MNQEVDSQDPNQQMWTRRKLLGTLGLTGLGTLATTPIQATQKGGHANILSHGTISDLQNDKTLRENSLVYVFGYYKIGDGGDALYQVSKAENIEKENPWTISLQNELVACLLNVKSVNYKMFGAVGDSVNDDSQQIMKAHVYANWKRIPVVNMYGEYWLMKGLEIPIQTNVYFGQTIFHINEKGNTNNKSYFWVQSRHKPKNIEWSSEVKDRFIKALRPGLQIFPELEPFRNCFILVKDDDDRVGFRAGARYNGTSWAREDFFYVEEHGRIVGDITWSFNNYTSLVAYPVEDHYLEIEGGTFYISGDIPGDKNTGYKRNGFNISRSRTLIRNQWVGLERGAKDISMSPRAGFYSFSRVYDILLENVRVIPWEQDRDGTDRDVTAGTYGIGVTRVMKAMFRNVIAEGGPVHWGVFGNNLIKDFVIDRCQLNRVDVHFHGWNIHIKDSKIGYRGITVTGGGELLIENTSCSNRFFLSFRRDYGAKWDGHITIRNCRYLPAPGAFNAVLFFQPADFEYGYPTGMARSIKVENLIIDYKDYSENDKVCWLIQTPDFSTSKGGDRQFFPRRIMMKDITVVGRQKGVRLLKLHDPSHYQVDKEGRLTDYQLDTNALISFEDVDLEDIITQSNETDYHLYVKLMTGENYRNDSLYPSISIKRCYGLKASLQDIAAIVDIQQSRVVQFICSDKNKLRGKLMFRDCTIIPVSEKEPSSRPYFILDSTLGTSFMNCFVHAPVIDNKPAFDHLNLIGFIEINRRVRFNHLHTVLGREIIEYYKNQKDGILNSFIAMLSNHYEVG